ncbi:MAG: class IV adenylate cyclase [Parcubacteria group bacterium]|nr:class IV adenylate cyclase [Parcubacteria group bacterium]
MEKEIEAKFKVKDFEKIHHWLEMVNARLVWGGTEISVYLDTVKGALKNNGRAFRIREWVGCNVMITIKGNPEKGDRKFMVRDEYQVDVNNLDEAIKMFEYLGFVKSLEYKKEREHWILPGGEAMELDILEDGRHFVEVEGSKKRIKEIAHAFGLDWSKSTTKSYPELLQEISSNT